MHFLRVPLPCLPSIYGRRWAIQVRWLEAKVGFLSGSAGGQR